MPAPRRALVLCLIAVAVTAGLRAGPGAGAGNTHSVVLMPDDGVWTAGQNVNGEIGDGTTTARLARTLVLSGALSVAAGANHTVAASSSGQVFAWGHNGFGQVGDGTQTYRYVPTAVPALSDVVAVAAGGSSTFSLKSDGTVWASGYNGGYGLGDGSTAQRLTPVGVSGITDASALAAGLDHALALRAGGTVVAWGHNQFGKLGDGTTTTRLTPVAVAGLTNIVAIAAGQAHSLALDATGRVYAWGSGFYGQLGQNTTADHWTPVLISSLTNVTAIAAGAQHSAALVDGQVWTWGYNAVGQLGLGDPSTRLVPTLVPGLTPIAAVAAGRDLTFAFAADGGLYAWGGNGSGQLGDGSTDHRFSPTVLAEAGGAWRVAVPRFSVPPGTYSTTQTVLVTSATPGATVRYTTTGVDPTEADAEVPGGGVLVDQSLTIKARAWKAGQPPSPVVSATYTLRPMMPTVTPSSGQYTTGQTVTVTSPTTGTTVRYTLDGTEPSPTSPAYTGPFAVSTATTVKATAFKSGWEPSTAATRTYTFNYGTLATPTASPAGGLYSTDQTVTLSGPAGATIRYTLDGSTPGTSSPLYTTAVTVNASATLKARAFHPDWTASPILAEVYTMKVATPAFTLASGTYAPGQAVALVTGTPGATIRYTLNGATPTASDPVFAPGTVLTLGNFTLKAAAWRTGYTTSDVATAAYSLSGDLTTTRIAAGHTHTVAVRNDGTVWAVGWNGWGGLGDGSTTQRVSPVMVSGLTGIRSVSAGQGHTLAVALDGRVFAWGQNTASQLGDGTTTYRTSPIQVPGLTTATAVAAGATHSLAVTSNGQVYAWGSNGGGQLGDGTTTTRAAPVLVNGLTDVIGVAAGESHSVAWTATGTVWAWGANSQGQLGDGTTTQRLTPVQVASLSTVTQLAAGQHHTLAVTGAGGVYAWGRNFNGQLGDATTTQRTAPTLLSGVTGVTSVAAGLSHSLVVTQGGVVYAWGLNSSAQVGDGTTTQRTAPVPVSGVTSVTSVAGGSVHSVALDGTDAVWTWGGNSSGQLGNGSTTIQTTPAPVSGSDLTWGVSPPTFTPAGGTYTSVQSVVPTSLTPAATIRYTTNGVEPTETDPVASPGAPIVVDRTLIVKAKAWKTGMTPSSVSTASYTLQLEAPTATPAGGLYASPQTVSLTGPAGSTLRYTVDGSDPTEASTLYTAAITVGIPLTLKVRAFRTDWSPSSVRTEHYAIGEDTTAPVVRAQPRPQLNAAGWAMTPTTVVFECTDAQAGIAACTAPFPVTEETAGITVTGSAWDRAGLTSTTSVVVRVDLTPPVVALSAPQDGLITEADTLTLTGTVSDALSGVASVACNGVAVSVNGEAVACTVPLRPGRNPLVLQASDAAGHSTSVGVTVIRTGAPTSLLLSPETVTLRVGEARPLEPRDTYGQVPSGVTWSVSDPAIVAVDTSAQPRLQALAAGTATVTASLNGLTAQMTVTVVDATVILDPGTVYWAVQAQPGFTLDRVIYTHRTDVDVPEAVLLETLGSQAILRGVDGDGRTMSVTPATSGATQAIGDSFGGVLLVFADAIERVALTPASRPWRYQAPFGVDHVVQTHDGTIFATETTGSSATGVITGGALIALDGATGTLKARVPVTTWRTDVHLAVDCHLSYDIFSDQPGFGLSDYALTTTGTYGIVVSEGHSFFSWMNGGVCDDQNPLSYGWERSYLLTLDSSGATAQASLEEVAWSSGSNPAIGVSSVLADARGNFVVRVGTEDRVLGPGAGGFSIGISDGMIVSEEGIVVAGGSSVTAVDVDTGTLLWSSAATGRPVATTEDGGVILLNANTLVVAGPEIPEPGIAITGELPQLDELAYSTLGLWYARVAGAFVKFGTREARRPYRDGRIGNYQGQGSQASIRFRTFLPEHVLMENPAQFAQDFAILFGAQVKGETISFVGPDALIEAFLDWPIVWMDTAKTKGPAEALAFIGHSVPASTIYPETSAGLMFFDRDLMKAPASEEGPYWTNGLPNRGQATAMYARVVKTQAKVLFFASCRVGDIFRSLWSLPVGGAMVLPLNPDGLTDLYQGAQAWRNIARDLAGGFTIGQAVANWNRISHESYHYTTEGNTSACLAMRCGQ